MREIKQTFVKADGARKVEIFQRADGTFGFEELKLGQGEGAWFPVGKYSIAIIDSLDTAVKEAKERVSWLAGDA